MLKNQLGKWKEIIMDRKLKTSKNRKVLSNKKMRTNRKEMENSKIKRKILIKLENKNKKKELKW